MEREILHKEIDFIQAVITRMANNSFVLKGWLVSLVAVVLALTKDKIAIGDIKYFSLTLCFPVLVFWYLDAFFLHKEKCYRKLYEWTIENRLSTYDFSYSLNYKRFEDKVGSVFKVMFTETLRLFYGFILIVLLIITTFNLCK